MIFSNKKALTPENYIFEDESEKLRVTTSNSLMPHSRSLVSCGIKTN
jgi:hypothetical protein